jgi:hypothetical protein
MQAGRLYILSVLCSRPAWHLPVAGAGTWLDALACCIIRKCTPQDRECVSGRARTGRTGQSDQRVKHLFQGTEAVNQEKQPNGALSRSHPSRPDT